MPFPNFHAARIRSPEIFERIRVLRTLSNGIMIYGGPLKRGGGTVAASYRFPKSKFTPAEARKWMKDHGLTVILFEGAKS